MTDARLRTKRGLNNLSKPDFIEMFRDFRVLASLLVLSAPLHLLSAPAEAALDYKLSESGGKVILEASGSLNLPAPSTNQLACYSDGGIAISPTFSGLCTGVDGPDSFAFTLTGPDAFTAGSGGIFPASSVSGTTTSLQITSNSKGLYLPGYVSVHPYPASLSSTENPWPTSD